MSLSVRLRIEAAEDLLTARAWLEQKEYGLGIKFANRTASVFETIERFPELYGVVWQQVRAAPIPKYLYVVYYTVLSNYIDVIAIIHAHRDSYIWQQRLRN